MNALHVARRWFPVLCLVLMVILATVGLQEANAYEVEYTSITVCNTGNIKFLVAVVKADYNVFSTDYRGDGWWEVTPGRCKRVDHRSQPGTYYLTFLQYDADGNPGIALYRPSGVSGIYKESGWSFCVKMKSYEYEESGKPTQDCPAPWILVPFPFSIWRVPGQNDLEINIPATSSARLVPIPGQTQPRSSSKPVETQAPPPPPPPPKKEWLGIQVLNYSLLNGVGTGIHIMEVVEGSPAMKAGLLKGDRIDIVSDKSLKPCKPQNMPELRACFEALYNADELMMVVKRGQQQELFIISPGEKPVVNKESNPFDIFGGHF